MDAKAILHQLAHAEQPPYEALLVVGDHREELTPLFLAEVESWIAATSEQRLADPSRLPCYRCGRGVAGPGVGRPLPPRGAIGV